MKPDSLITRLRFRLARRLDPYPEPGEAWCFGCALNCGRTMVLPASGSAAHIEQHRSHGSSVTIRSSERAGGEDGR